VNKNDLSLARFEGALRRGEAMTFSHAKTTPFSSPHHLTHASKREGIVNVTIQSSKCLLPTLY
jgi:hypothetical protein